MKTCSMKKHSTRIEYFMVSGLIGGYQGGPSPKYPFSLPQIMGEKGSENNILLRLMLVRRWLIWRAHGDRMNSV